MSTAPQLSIGLKIDPIMEFDRNNHRTILEGFNKYAILAGKIFAGGAIGGLVLEAGLMAIRAKVVEIGGVTLATAVAAAMTAGALGAAGDLAEASIATASAALLVAGVAAVAGASGAQAVAEELAVGAAVSAGAAITEALVPSDQGLSNRATRAFFNAIFRNDIESFPGDSRSKKLDNYQSLMPNAMEMFSKTMLEQLIRCSSDPTTLNTPDFLHPILSEIAELRAVYRQLENPYDFCLMNESLPAMPGTLRGLLAAGKELTSLHSPLAREMIPWQLVSDCAARLKKPDYTLWRIMPPPSVISPS